MKKISALLALILVLASAVTVFYGCDSGESSESTVSVPKNEPTTPGATVSNAESTASGEDSSSEAPADNSKRNTIIRYIAGGVLVIAVAVLFIGLHVKNRKER